MATNRKCDAHNKKQPRQQRQTTTAGGLDVSSWLMSLETQLVGSLRAPEEVELFAQIEELARSYAIESPFVARTQLELMFDAFDGRQLPQTGSGEAAIDEDSEELEQKQQLQVSSELGQTPDEGPMAQVGGQANWRPRASRRHQRARRPGGLRRLLGALGGAFPVADACLTSSESSKQELSLYLTPACSFSLCGGHLSSSNSEPPLVEAADEALARALLAEVVAQQDSSRLGMSAHLRNSMAALTILSGETHESQPAFCSTAHATGSGLMADEEKGELCNEALRIVAPLVARLRRSSRLQPSSGEAWRTGNEFARQTQLLMGETCSSVDPLNVTICVFVKRNKRHEPMLEAQNGRLWWFVQSRLNELRWRLRQTSADYLANGLKSINSSNSRLELKLQQIIDSTNRRLARRRKRRMKTRGKAEKLSNDQLERLVSLTKDSLNNLIDAQLLLRNKLTSEQQQQHQHQLQTPQMQHSTQSQMQLNSFRANEYDLLMKNNFNLLKIWQNIEETKRLVCFVCEPIKATLADLFWFSRQAPEVRGACSAGSAQSSNYMAGTSAQSSVGMQFNDCLLASPLVCQDAIQVKNGLIQILEALHYLHAICKLIHRNVNPRNILIASNDNWKLSGLEFAIKFESTTISESASIIAHEGTSLLLRYSMGNQTSAQSALRRQKTLHQTKCEEFVKRPKSCRALQPEIDYLAPEIWASAKCSHKSDMFSFGLILGQTYDAWRHKPPIGCQANSSNYESELKKLMERRKRRLAYLVPPEMRAALLAMLDKEANLRPSANYALQLLRRPIELSNTKDDSLRHLRRTLDYLNSRFLSSAPRGASQHPAATGSGQQVAGGRPMRSPSYFRRVTGASGRQAPSESNCSPAGSAPQTELTSRRSSARNLHLLNLLLRAIDALAAGVASATSGAQPSRSPADNCGQLKLQQQQQQQQQQQGQNFPYLRCQFECTFETLRQVYATQGAQNALGQSDSRSSILLVALHRRLLEQLSGMRSSLALAATSAGPNQRGWAAQNQRLLADSEDKLHSLVSRHSLGKLAPALADPLLKLDELILIFELLSDLLAFVGQKHKRDYTQRGRQLLSELTPVTGCAPLSSSSSSSDEEQAEILATGGLDYYTSELMSHQMNAPSSSMTALGGPTGSVTSRNLTGSRETLNSLASQAAGASGQLSRLGSHRYSDYSDDPAKSQQYQQQLQARYQLPTKISITAPSPMGSLRDMNRSSADSHVINSQLANLRYSQSQAQTQSQHQQQQQHQLSRQSDEQSLVDRTNELQLDNQQSSNDSEQVSEKEGDRTRSLLIDELLKTINDDSFNDFSADLNSKSAGSRAGQQHQQQQQQQQTAVQLANSSRPKSAMDSTNSDKFVSTISGRQQVTPQHLRSNALPQTPSSFDNMIRRMSTNLVQNFSNKMGGSISNAMDQQDSLSLRRERSSQNTNSLYVDNQAPVRRHSDNTINIPRIQVALSSPQAGNSRTNLNQRASLSASKLANKWKLTAKTHQRESGDKLSPSLGGALNYMRRHSSGNTTGNDQSNGHGSNLLLNASPFKTRSSSNLGLDFLLSNRSMKRRYSAASMLGHQTQRKAEDLIDAGMKSVQNMFS